MLNSIRRRLGSKYILPSLAIGIVSGIESSFACLAYALMIFSGDLASQITIGITILFLGCAIHAVVAALSSSQVGILSGTQDSPSVIVAVVIASMLAQMPQASQETKLYTALAGIILTSMITGLACLFLGKFKLGGLVSYIPYPVVGGFLAGTGILLLLGGLGVMTQKSITLFNLGLLFKPDTWYLWAVGMLFGVILYVLNVKFNHYLVMPGTMAAAIAIFYLIVALSGTSISKVTGAGWLGSGIPEGKALFHFWSPAGFASVDWNILFGQTGSLLACVLVSLISLLLNTVGMEVATKHEVDLNTELKSNGWANLIAGAAGSPIGYPILSDTTLAYNTGARVRTNGIFAGLFIVLVLVAGGEYMGYVPNLVLGGIVFETGMCFISSWLYNTWSRIPWSDYAIIVLIAALITLLGILPGVGIGLVTAVILFAIHYSRTHAVRHTFSGVSYQSSVERTRLAARLLTRYGDWLYILELQGYIFFGTATQVLEEIRAYLDSPGRVRPPHFILLDFRLVPGMDSSAAYSFVKVKRLAQARGITLVITHLAPGIQKQFRKDLPSESFHYCPDLDHGIEWCENQMVELFEDEGFRVRNPSLFQQLTRTLPEPEQVEILRQYLKPRQVEAGGIIIQQGSKQNGLYMIERGQVVIQIHCEDGSLLRLRTLGAGTFFGEMGLYSGEPATADVIAEQETNLYVLIADDLAELERTAPNVAAALHRFVATYMSERLAKVTATLQALH